MSNVSIRYSRTDSRAPKNTLATIRDGDQIYFGIARCNSQDLFRKRVGREVAGTRALRAKNKELFGIQDSNLQVDESGLRGLVKREHVKELINYFKNIDNVELVWE